MQKFKKNIRASVRTDDNEDGGLLVGILAKISADELGAITGSLGRIKGVRVKSAVLPLETGAKES